MGSEEEDEEGLEAPQRIPIANGKVRPGRAFKQGKHELLLSVRGICRQVCCDQFRAAQFSVCLRCRMMTAVTGCCWLLNFGA